MMHRFYADSSVSDHDCFFLNEEDSHHAVRVLRLHSGSQVEAIFEQKRYLSVIDIDSSSHIILRPLRQMPSTEPSLAVTLFQGLPKGDKMDLIVQKASEIGAVRIIPVVFSRSIVRINDKDAEKKTERWKKISREAGKQSGRCRIPEIHRVIPFSSLPELIPSCEHVVVPWEECNEGGPLSFFQHHPMLSSLGIIIGPEGGISPEEMKQLQEMKCEAITLGKRILRTETAGLAAISVFLGLYGEME